MNVTTWHTEDMHTSQSMMVAWLVGKFLRVRLGVKFFWSIPRILQFWKIPKYPNTLRRLGTKNTVVLYTEVFHKLQFFCRIGYFSLDLFFYKRRNASLPPLAETHLFLPSSSPTTTTAMSSSSAMEKPDSPRGKEGSVLVWFGLCSLLDVSFQLDWKIDAI